VGRDNLRQHEASRKIFSLSAPLETIAEVQATSTAAEADEYSKLISDKHRGIKIINTGTIDRYRTTHGIKPIRDKGRSFLHPYLDTASKQMNPDRKSLYHHPKIIFAKLALRIEAFLDEKGEYASINTNCVHDPKSSELTLEYLVGLLNSSLMSFLYSELFRGLTMSKGYFQFQSPQLRILPIRKATAQDQQALIAFVKDISSQYRELNALGDKKTDQSKSIQAKIDLLDSKIDELVFNIYQLSEEEKRTISQTVKRTP
jgi:TaqI-like C-terminal specificity domain